MAASESKSVDSLLGEDAVDARSIERSSPPPRGVEPNSSRGVDARSDVAPRVLLLMLDVGGADPAGQTAGICRLRLPPPVGVLERTGGEKPWATGSDGIGCDEDLVRLCCAAGAWMYRAFRRLRIDLESVAIASVDTVTSRCLSVGLTQKIKAMPHPGLK